MDDLEDEDDDLESCWAELEPLPSFVYTVDQCTGPEGVLGGFISRHEVMGADDENWLVGSSEVAWSGPKAPKEIQLFPTSNVPKLIAFTTPSQAIENLRAIRMQAMVELTSQKNAALKIIRQKQAEVNTIEAREKALDGLQTPVISNPIIQFADIEKL